MMGLNILERWRRLRALDPGDRSLLLEAAIMLAIAQAGLRTLPFSAVRRMLGAAKHTRSRTYGNRARIAWAINAAARHTFGQSCLPVALAADVMLHRRGHPSVLRLGVKKETETASVLQAHAWVECDGAVVAGALQDLDEYRSFPCRSVTG